MAFVSECPECLQNGEYMFEIEKMDREIVKKTERMREHLRIFDFECSTISLALTNIISTY